MESSYNMIPEMSVPFLAGHSDKFIFDDVPAILENKVSSSHELLESIHIYEVWCKPIRTALLSPQANILERRREK
jgi:hypothetical protein